MYKKSLLGLGVVAIVGMALGACSGPATSPDTASAKPSEKAAQTKRYSNGELLDLVKQIKTADGTSLTTVSGEELSNQENPMKELLALMSIEPAECKALGALGSSQTIAGSTTAGGASVDTAGGVMSGITLVSGVDADALRNTVKNNKSQAAACENITLSMAGQSMDMTTKPVDGVSSVPDTVAYKTAISLPDGREQSTFIAYAVKDGVLITATASGQNADATGAAAAGALMDQAAALIK